MSLRGRAQNYRHCDSTWTFVLNECDLKIEDKSIKSKHCKIVAFDAALDTNGKKPPAKNERRKDGGSKAGSSRKKKREDRKKHPPNADGIKKEKLEEGVSATYSQSVRLHLCTPHNIMQTNPYYYWR
eukprot:TRINITY_DN71077_c1_g1_i1.p4 TRINITY_DN71077_c1_g1~~TRINITY_DN71077_c1_g1_i1.p4  ORF type:complete len:127 (+),score=12.82 TRINITY_DN71077_c1_g1_i1:304-684(+)